MINDLAFSLPSVLRCDYIYFYDRRRWRQSTEALNSQLSGIFVCEDVSFVDPYVHYLYSSHSEKSSGERKTAGNYLPNFYDGLIKLSSL